MTSAWVRTELSVSFGARTFRFDSQVSMVRNDFQRHGGKLRGRRGQQAGPIAPHHLIAVVAVIGRVDAGTLGEAAPDVVDALLVVAARIDDRQLARFLPLDTIPAR